MGNITLNMYHPDKHPPPVVAWCFDTKTWRLPGGDFVKPKSATDHGARLKAIALMVPHALACGYKLRTWNGA